MIQKTNGLEIDHAQIDEFATAIWEPNDRIEIRPLRPLDDSGESPDGTRKWPYANSIGNAIDSNYIPLETYFGANPRTRDGGGKAEHVALARALFADFDFDGGSFSIPADALSRVSERGLPSPTIAVETGNGVHVWWRLSEPLTDLAKFTELQRRIAKRLGSDPKVIDPPRIMRLPGTFSNVEKSVDPTTGCRTKDRKVLRSVPKPVRIVHRGPAVHDLAVFESVLPAIPPDPPKKVFEPINYECPDDAALEKRVFAYLDKCKPSIEGQNGSGALFHALCLVVDNFALNEQWLRRAAEYYNSTKCDPPWSEKELDHKIQDALKQKGERRQVGAAFADDAARGRSRHPMMPKSDFGDLSPPETEAVDKSLDAAVNGEASPHSGAASDVCRNRWTESEFSKLVAKKYGDRIRWVPAWKRFHIWEGRLWAPDDGSLLDAFIRDTADPFLSAVLAAIDAEEIVGTEARDALKHARRMNSSAGKNAIRDLLKSEPGISVEPGVFDANDYLLNVQNGVVNLRTGDLLAHDPKFMQSKIAATIYDPEAKFPTWLRVLPELFAGNRAMVAYLQRALGYMLTGDVSEHKLFIWWGAGGNGKGTIVETIMGLMGDYATAGAPNLLMVKNESHPTEIADLQGHRLVICSETEQNKRLAEARVKQFTGGDTLKGRGVFENFSKFRPAHKLLMLTNYKPVLLGTDDGIRRRLNLVEWNVGFSDDDPAKPKPDKKLPDKLKAEWPGILQWMIAGCRMWQEIGLDPPAEVVEATQRYIKEEDAIGRFIEAKCKTGPDLRVRARDVYAAYQEWCAEAGENRTVSQKVFGQWMERNRYETKVSNGTWYLGLWCLPPTPGAGANGSKNPEPLEPSGSDDGSRTTYQRGLHDGIDVLDT
jgi:putative DNA primase/helicase